MSYKNKQSANIPRRQSTPPPPRRVVNDSPRRRFSLSIKNSDDVLEKEAESQFPLERKNFILMIVAAVMIVVGFLLMLGGSSTETEFNPDIFSTRRIVIGPTIAFLGFLVMGFAVIYLPRSRKNAAVKDAADSVAKIENNDNL